VIKGGGGKREKEKFVRADSGKGKRGKKRINLSLRREKRWNIVRRGKKKGGKRKKRGQDTHPLFSYPRKKKKKTAHATPDEKRKSTNRFLHWSR